MVARANWSGEQDIELLPEEIGPPSRGRFTVPVPEQEGVDDLVLSASRRGLQERFARRVAGTEERRLQFVVVNHDRPPAPPAQAGRPGRAGRDRSSQSRLV